MVSTVVECGRRADGLSPGCSEGYSHGFRDRAFSVYGVTICGAVTYVE